MEVLSDPYFTSKNIAQYQEVPKEDKDYRTFCGT